MRTRVRIVEAAHRVFVERGYAGATIPRIAAEAGVAVETVYRSASGKSGLLAAAVQAALAGGAQRAEVPVEQRPAIRQVIDEPDPRRQLQAYAATQPGSGAGSDRCCGFWTRPPAPTKHSSSCVNSSRSSGWTGFDVSPCCSPSAGPCAPS